MLYYTGIKRICRKGVFSGKVLGKIRRLNSVRIIPVFQNGENFGVLRMKKKETNALQKIPNGEKTASNASSDRDLENSLSAALKQKNEKSFFAVVLVIAAVVSVLVIAAVSDILTLCFHVHKIFGYAMLALTIVLIFLFVLRPMIKVISARFFITDVTAEGKNLAKRRNKKALRETAQALVAYNTDPKNMRCRYLSAETVDALSDALSSGKTEEIRSALKKAYAGDVGRFSNGVIFKCAGKAFLQTSVSQNDKIDALCVLLTNLSLVKQIVAIYGYRPSYAKLFKIYLSVLTNTLIAYGMENVNWFNVFGKFFSGAAKKIPFLDTLVDGAVQGTVSAFLTLLVGYKTKRYLCSDYKKQENIDASEATIGDDEVKIASELAVKIRSQKGKAASFAEEAEEK